MTPNQVRDLYGMSPLECSGADGGIVVPECLVPELKLRLAGTPNGLYGAYINEDGDAV